MAHWHGRTTYGHRCTTGTCPPTAYPHGRMILPHGLMTHPHGQATYPHGWIAHPHGRTIEKCG